MPLQATSGAASYDGFGGGVAAVPKYIEDYFSTFLYSGTGSSQTINNGIDLSTKGGLVWIKSRSAGFESHRLTDSARGTTKQLKTNGTDAQTTNSDTITAFNTTGFTLGTGATLGDTNASGETYVGWSWAKAPKFFDVVTYTGNGTTQDIAHSLGSAPGCVIVKCTSNSGYNWAVYHRSLSSGDNLRLNTTDSSSGAALGANGFGNNTSVVAPTSTVFTVGNNGNLNNSGWTYVAYLFAHNAGGFGLTGTDNVISCGSYTGTSDYGGPFVDLGFEPQWLLIKSAGSVKNWVVLDNMRGLTASGDNEGYLVPNTSDQEYAGTLCKITSTGFQANGSSMTGANGVQYIYIAIRRGPMKVPTSGTTVFTPITYNGNGTSQTITGSVGVPDLGLGIGRTGGAAGSNAWYDRLRGKELALRSTTTSAQYDASPGGEGTMTNVMNGMRVENTYGILNDASTAYILYFMSRAPSFFDEVCYEGTGSATTQAHNLGVVPEMMIVKGRTNTFSWFVYQEDLTTANQSFLTLNTDSAVSTGSAVWNSTSPTSSVFSIGSANAINQSGQTYVAYLFATCAGVSKVGSYTGNGTTQTINCGFGAGGARFVLIKRTDSTGDWYVYDTARGMTVLTDPYLLMNSTAAESATLGSVTTVSTGFAVNASILAAINTNAASYIFLAIA